MPPNPPCDERVVSYVRLEIRQTVVVSNDLTFVARQATMTHEHREEYKR